MDADCKGGAEVGIDWINHLVLHENDPDWHLDPEFFAEANDDRFGPQPVNSGKDENEAD